MSGTLDLVIGVAFLYLLLSLMVTTINEICAAVWNSRGKYLATVIENLVDDPAIRARLQAHSLIKPVASSKLPSYIAPRGFALALLNSIHPLNAATVRTAADVAAALNGI